MYSLRVFEAHFQIFEVNRPITKEREKINKTARKTAKGKSFESLYKLLQEGK